MNEKKVYRGFVRVNETLTHVYVKTKDLETALNCIKEVPGLTQIISVGEEKDTIIL